LKLYDFTLAPNPRRVRIFLAEKGVEVPMEQVNTREGAQFQPQFLAVNARGTVPTLVLDDGTVLTESVAICRYFEETHPEPSLFGRTATQRAVIENWNRRAEIEGMTSVSDALRNTLPMFAERGLVGAPDGVPQIAALAERGKAMLERWLGHLDARLATTRFLAGETFSIADITAYISFETAKRLEYEVSANYPNVVRWLGEIAARPSSSA
jgi:glutathione S-transferase